MRSAAESKRVSVRFQCQIVPSRLSLALQSAAVSCSAAVRLHACAGVECVRAQQSVHPALPAFPFEQRQSARLRSVHACRCELCCESPGSQRVTAHRHRCSRSPSCRAGVVQWNEPRARTATPGEHCESVRRCDRVVLASVVECLVGCFCVQQTGRVMVQRLMRSVVREHPSMLDPC